jgi:hypothetical protein
LRASNIVVDYFEPLIDIDCTTMQMMVRVDMVDLLVATLDTGSVSLPKYKKIENKK